MEALDSQIAFLQTAKSTTNFTIMRVKGSITWKHLGADGSHSTLKLKRLGSKHHADILKLKTFKGTSDNFATDKFEFPYSSNGSSWGCGDKGQILACPAFRQDAGYVFASCCSCAS